MYACVFKSGLRRIFYKNGTILLNKLELDFEKPNK